jgi:hypothetical protein
MMTALFCSSTLRSKFDKHELFLLACFVMQMTLDYTVSVWEETQRGDVRDTPICAEIISYNIPLGLQPPT